MSTTWQTVYEQLQEFLNECIELWWNSKYFYWNDPKKISLMLDNIWVNNTSNVLYMSYHELFSKDSGIMEFVYWYCDYDETNNSGAAYFSMSEMTAEEKIQYFLYNAIIPWTSK